MSDPVAGSSPLWLALAEALDSPAALSVSVEPELAVVDSPGSAVPVPVEVLEGLPVAACVPEVLDDGVLVPLVLVPVPVPVP